MTESYSEVTSWTGRLGNSIKSVLVGFVLFIAAFPILSQNEGCAVRRDKALKEGAGQTVTVDAAKLDPANDKKLICVSGKAVTMDKAQDPDFGISVNAVSLARTVKMYQWVESTRTEKRGAKEEKFWDYKKDWSDKEIDSSAFKKPEGHRNPPMAYKSNTFTAATVMLGQFEWPKADIGKIGPSEKYAAASTEGLPSVIKANTTIQAGTLYVRAAGPATAPTTSTASTPPTDKAEPAIGDMKISFDVTPSGRDMTVWAQQNAKSFAGFYTKADPNRAIYQMKPGILTKEAMLEVAQKENTIMTWILRLAGFLMMFIGLTMVASPIAVFGDAVPLVGDMLRAGAAVFAGLIAFALSFITIAIAWVAYRPLVGIPLLIIGVGAIILLKLRGRDKRIAPAPAAPAR